MAKDWDYARLSQEAKAGGGPDEWIATIKKPNTIEEHRI